MLLSEPAQPTESSVVDSLLPLVFESWPGQVPPRCCFFCCLFVSFNLAEKLIAKSDRKYKNNGSSS